MKRSRIRRHSPSTYLSPSPSPRSGSPRPPSSADECDGDTVMTTSRPTSLAILASANRPTLKDILTNNAPPPWTLSAFMAYLSQNHCLETLEFTMEAERYKAAYVQALHPAAIGSSYKEERERLCLLWQKLINAYILPCGPREVNLPAPVRDRLLSLGYAYSPPDPSQLDDAVRIVYELMNDSVLLPFLDAVSASPAENQGQTGEEGHDNDSRLGRPRLRMPKDKSSSGDESSRSPKASFLPLTMGSRGEAKSRSASTEATDREAGSDDSGSSASPSGDPLTPPTTPPTSDWGFGSSPSNQLQRAISMHNNGWKKVGARLGIGRKGRPSHRVHTSNFTTLPGGAQSSDGDVTMSDAGPAPGSSNSNHSV